MGCNNTKPVIVPTRLRIRVQHVPSLECQKCGRPSDIPIIYGVKFTCAKCAISIAGHSSRHIRSISL
jgi:hypothetical protein